MLASFSVTSLAFASEKLEGCFVAKLECDALHSIKKQTNPNNIKLTPFGLYSVTASNKVKASHYQVIIPNNDLSKPSVSRWVPVSCGNYIPNCRLIPSGSSPTDNPTESASVNTTIPTKNPQYLLALSWEPSFCETHKQKKECKTLTPSRYDANNLALHGLWPQPRNNAYCNVDTSTKAIDRHKKWHLLKKLELSDATRKSLAVIMPGYASNLQRHEWVKHGTCSGFTAERYYQNSIWLTETINRSSTANGKFT